MFKKILSMFNRYFDTKPAIKEEIGSYVESKVCKDCNWFSKASCIEQKIADDIRSCCPECGGDLTRKRGRYRFKTISYLGREKYEMLEFIPKDESKKDDSTMREIIAWRRDSRGSQRDGMLGSIGKITIFTYHYNLPRHRGNNEYRYTLNSLLPGTAQVVGNFKTAEDTRMAAEIELDSWLSKTSLKFSEKKE